MTSGPTPLGQRNRAKGTQQQKLKGGEPQRTWFTAGAERRSTERGLPDTAPPAIVEAPAGWRGDHSTRGQRQGLGSCSPSRSGGLCSAAWRTRRSLLRRPRRRSGFLGSRADPEKTGESRRARGKGGRSCREADSHLGPGCVAQAGILSSLTPRPADSVPSNTSGNPFSL